jgi:hypothetical protein
LCLHGVGGAAHPDELLGRLTGRQWAGWQIYCRHFLTPEQRADVNAALVRRDCGQWKKVPDANKLIPHYGGRRPKSDRELKATVVAWAAQATKKA